MGRSTQSILLSDANSSATGLRVVLAYLLIISQSTIGECHKHIDTSKYLSLTEFYPI